MLITQHCLALSDFARHSDKGSLSNVYIKPFRIYYIRQIFWIYIHGSAFSSSTAPIYYGYLGQLLLFNVKIRNTTTKETAAMLTCN